MLNKVQFRSVRDFGEVINDTFLFIKQNFKPLMKAFFYFCGLFMLGSALSGIMQQFNLQNEVSTGSGASVSSFFSVAFWLAIIFSVLNYTALIVFTLGFIALYVEKGSLVPTKQEIWGYFKYYFFRVLLANILLSIIMIISFFLLLIPFFYIFPAMSLLMPIMVMENANFSYSFSKSFNLLKSQWWITFGTLIILWIITYALFMAVALPGIVMGIAGKLVPGSDVPHPAVTIFYTLIQQFANVFMLIPIIGVSIIYFNLVERQENIGLFDRINQFGEEEQKKDVAEEY